MNRLNIPKEAEQPIIDASEETRHDVGRRCSTGAVVKDQLK